MEGEKSGRGRIKVGRRKLNEKRGRDCGKRREFVREIDIVCNYLCVCVSIFIYLYMAIDRYKYKLAS